MIQKTKFEKTEFDSDVLDLLRKIVGTPKLTDTKHYEKLSGQERLDFLKYCRFVYGDKHFEEIFRHLVFECVLKAALEARNFDEVLVNRASANGVSMVKEFFKRYNNIYIEEFEDKPKPEDFDERKAFEPLTTR